MSQGIDGAQVVVQLIHPHGPVPTENGSKLGGVWRARNSYSLAKGSVISAIERGGARERGRSISSGIWWTRWR
jgi:hypothetical protein